MDTKTLSFIYQNFLVEIFHFQAQFVQICLSQPSSNTKKKHSPNRSVNFFIVPTYLPVRRWSTPLLNAHLHGDRGLTLCLSKFLGGDVSFSGSLYIVISALIFFYKKKPTKSTDRFLYSLTLSLSSSM